MIHEADRRAFCLTCGKHRALTTRGVLRVHRVSSSPREACAGSGTTNWTYSVTELVAAEKGTA